MRDDYQFLALSAAFIIDAANCIVLEMLGSPPGPARYHADARRYGLIHGSWCTRAKNHCQMLLCKGGWCPRKEDPNLKGLSHSYPVLILCRPSTHHTFPYPY